MRFWANKTVMDNPPQKPITKRDKIITVLSMLADATIIGLLVYTLMVNSCQICYQTNAGSNTFKQCKGMSDVMETGLPSEVINIYEGKTINEVNTNETLLGSINTSRIATAIE